MIQTLFSYASVVMYACLALIALWGAFCVVMVWMRVNQSRFRSEAAQDEFLDAVEAPIAQGDFDSAASVCEGDRRAMCQLSLLAIARREIGYNRVRELVVDRFQRDVLADLEQRLSWVNTVIKAAPMVGLLGTVIGMMGAFATLGGAEGGAVKVDELATDIYTALITTACGLAIAIPLIFCTASINIRIRKMEELVAAGLTRFFEVYKEGLKKAKPVKPAGEPRRGQQPVSV